MTRWGALLAALALAGCSSGGDSIFERLRPLAEEALFGGPLLGDDKPPPPARKALTRAQLAQIPFATIAVTVEDAPRSFVVATADNGGYVAYTDAGRRSLILRGGLLTGTRGLGFNLSSVKHAQNDPVISARAVSDWPASIIRNYQFALVDADDFEITVRCAYTKISPETIEIVEIAFDVVRMLETCSNGVRTFENLYWADQDTGFVWKSRQWAGPRQPPLTIEIIRPYAAG